ncbi:hypothetical protein HanXRQr2_Chr02g0075061 [Helianthus annuus]|uniref:Uncharacterized protein n=1 Tax=Helianthus annuus TaxID=4232 RepID=A0A9K3JP56_HELAN|nr:hypothetical protein HanXRQr2_Chr02g0075061 [Helianthus annuus]KAJ0952467.1 hypothetical protein HanPSC8_Chr02g0072631 [Helianthus annuus]
MVMVIPKGMSCHVGRHVTGSEDGPKDKPRGWRMGPHTIYKNKSKLPFWSLWFGQFCHFNPNLKLFKSGSLWFAFCCHFSPNLKKSHYLLFQHVFFVFLCRVVLSNYFSLKHFLN